jgi:hypothetical protein
MQVRYQNVKNSCLKIWVGLASSNCRKSTCWHDAGCHDAGQIIGAGDKDLLRLLLRADVPEQVFASKLIRSMVLAKWHTFALPRIKLQGAWFVAYLAIFIAYQVRAGSAVSGGLAAQCTPSIRCCFGPLKRMSQGRGFVSIAPLMQVLAVLTSGPSWGTAAELWQDGRGKAAVVLGSALLLLTVGQSLQYVWQQHHNLTCQRIW